MGKLEFNPEATWLNRIDSKAQRVDLAGPHGIPPAQLTEAICLRIIESRRSNWQNKLDDVPVHLRTPAVCLAAIKKYSRESEAIPPEVWTPEFIDAALLSVPCGDQLLQYIPKDLITEAICQYCIKLNGYALGDVPDRYKTDALCLAAIQNNGSAIAFVPGHLRNIENFRIAAASNPFGAMGSICADEVTPEQYEELWRIALNTHGTALEILRDVAAHLITPDLVDIAITNTPYAIRYVPDGLVTPAILRSAVAGKATTRQEEDDGIGGRPIISGPLSIIEERWPKKITADLCLAAVQHRWQAIVDVPPDFLSETVAMAAITQHEAAFNWLPKKLRYTMPEVATAWVRGDPSRISEITDPEIFRKVMAALDLENAMSNESTQSGQFL